MRRIRTLLGLSAVLVAALGGCALTQNELKPPKPPEEFKAPPEDDPRYSRPIEYPKDTMDNDVLTTKIKSKGPGSSGPPKAGSIQAPGPRGF
jgi:hypothetical protein